ncbi:MAG: hypothetical protein AAFO07_19010 [Bacteroidota bacterium]
MSNSWSKISFGFLVFLFVGSYCWGQNLSLSPTDNSPFSRLGIGNFFDQQSAAQLGMGGLSTAIIDPFHLNFENPAALAYLQATSFEVAFSAKYSSYSEENQTEDFWTGNLNYLALGFPLINPINRILDRDQRPLSLGMSISLRPYTVVGYDILNEIEFSDIGTTLNSFKGSGGTYRLMWGNALRYKNLSVGFQFGSIFGKVINSRRIEFSDLDLSYSTEQQDDVVFGGWLWDFGALYTLPLNKVEDPTVRNRPGEAKQLVIGVQANNSNTINTTLSSYFRRESTLIGIADTLSAFDELRGKATLPSSVSLGVTYETFNRLKVGLEYTLGMWSEYENEALPEVLNDSYEVRVGLEYIPDITSFNRYFKKVRYRFGAFYGNDPRSINGQQLENYGITLGIGMPMIKPRETTSYFNISLELGQFGISDILRETYGRLTFGFALNDNSWFFKRKFD